MTNDSEEDELISFYLNSHMWLVALVWGSEVLEPIGAGGKFNIGWKLKRV